MKKFLSLVLALVMTMSLVTISAGAYTDDSKVNYDEAVDVISALGIVGGYPDGSFKPQGTLTRGAAAKIICNLMLGVKTASELPSIASYKDVPAGSTYAPYIAYLKNEGVVGGYADGTFKPAATLTGYHFLKMLLGAMGYNAKAEGLEGDGWQINVAKLAKQAKLYDGNKNFKGNEPATREEACLYALNTMMAGTVKYDNQSSITIGDIVIQNNSKAEATGECFYETNFDTLKKTTTAITDAQGRPGTKWEYGKGADKKTIGNYGTTADYVVTATSTWTDALAELRKALDDKNIVGPTGNIYYVNDDTATSLGTNIKSGDVVEVFMDSTNSNLVERLVVSQYALGEITKVETKVTNKADIKNGVSAYITVKVAGTPVTYKDIYFKGFDAATYVKGAKILVCAGTSVVDGTTVATVFDSAIPETVEGKVTAVKGSKVTINGTVYTNKDGNWASPAIDEAGVFYLDKAGNIKSADLTTTGTVDQYVYIYGANVKQDVVSDDGVKLDNLFTLYGVNAAGEKVSFKVKKDADVKKFFSESSGKYSVRADAAVKVTAYKLDDDGYFETVADAADWSVHQGTTALGKTSTTTTTAKVTVSGSGDNTYYASNDTQFVFASKKDDAMKVTTAVGYKNVNIAADKYYIVAKDSDIKVVFSIAKDEGATADETYVLGVVTDATPSKSKDGSDTLFTYSVLVNGEKTELTKKKTELSVAAGSVYKFVMDGDYVKSAEILSSNTISKVASDETYFVTSSTEYSLENDATVYTVYENYKSEGGAISFDNYTIAADSNLSVGTKVWTFKDKDDNYTYFFWKSNYADFT